MWKCSVKEKISSIKYLASGQIFLNNTLFQNVGRMAWIFFAGLREVLQV